MACGYERSTNHAVYKWVSDLYQRMNRDIIPMNFRRYDGTAMYKLLPVEQQDFQGYGHGNCYRNSGIIKYARYFLR